MSTFNHPQLVRNINEGLMGLRKWQPDAMQAFGQLSRAAMGEGTVSTKHKELITLDNWHYAALLRLNRLSCQSTPETGMHAMKY